MVEIKPLSIDVLIKELSGAGSECKIESQSLDRSFLIRSLAEPQEATAQSISFFISEAFLSTLESTKASVLVCSKNILEKAKDKLGQRNSFCLISCEDAYLGLARLSHFLAENNANQIWEPSKNFISEDVQVGARTKIFPNVCIGPGVSIGDDCVLFPGVVVYPGTQIGNRVRLHANVVIGSDGFGYAKSKTGSVKIHHLGKVIIGDDVEIGSGTAIDRGTMKNTIIENGAKIDNLVQIGHNCHIKAHAILCGQVGLAGGTTVGVGAILAGQAGIADKVEIGNGAIIGPQAGISKDVPDGEIMMGTIPSKPRRQWWKLMAYFERIPEVFDRLKKLEKEILK